MFIYIEGIIQYRIIDMRKGSLTGHEFCPLNHSPSKMAYSFSKELRFRMPKLENPNSNFYDISGKLNTRATGFGYGNKSTITLPSLKNPSPDCYNLESDLVIQQKSKKGSVFGQSRDKVNSGYLGKKDKLPGPGQYDLTRSSLTNMNFTMKGQKSRSFYKEKQTPGPGQYDSLTAFKSGWSVLSSVKSSGGVKINPLKERSSLHSYSPGPGEYEASNCSMEKGSMNSKLRNSQKCIFPKTIRTVGFTKENFYPGPGAYDCHSQFS